ncbi:ABC transporter substrate-binding protein [Pseudonocardia lacus]|uniref:ABC transporter substrate-binding protein n=1 Tax=Pseudonocardia lacus TaxID=2835865 RepID=UPI001BDD8A1C|nr:ABC transporter substrate-binding protein [Pseudonocardia lacus]
MSRPASQSAYLAGLVPPSVAATGVRRRSLLTGALAGAGLLGAGGLLGGCASADAVVPAAGDGIVKFGSNQSDDVPRKAYEEIVAGFDRPGLTVVTNTVDHNAFQENINNYLLGQSDDVFTWFAGYRMQFFAEQGLVGDISEIWQTMTGMTDALRTASSGRDGRQYFVPLDYYPWAVFYRPSLFEEHGYRIPATLDEMVVLGEQMQAAGLIPLAFADQEGWPAMGTFDQLNLRLNGFDYHMSLMTGRESWDGQPARRVFELWRDLMPLHQTNPLQRTWQDGAAALERKQAGMMVMGMGLVGHQFADANRDDLDFFAFPQIDAAIGTGAVEAPIDGFMMRAFPRNRPGALEFLSYLAEPATQRIYTTADTTVVAANSETDTSGYTALQRKARQFVDDATDIAQFMDRDTRPDFASAVLLPAIQQFLADPAGLTGTLSVIESRRRDFF